MMVIVTAAACAQRASQPDGVGAKPEAAAKAKVEAGAAGWRLIEPPLVRDPRLPRAHRIQTDAPIGQWSTVGNYPDLARCERAMRDRVDDAIDRANATSGADAKHDLTVRRAVNGQCVQPK